MSETGTRAWRCRYAALALMLALPAAVAAEPAGPLASRVEDNRSERTHENLTAQGTWTGTVQPAAAEPAEASRNEARPASVSKLAKKRVRLSNKSSRTQTVQRSLNFNDIRRGLFAWN